jgi:hypothetical protein
MFNPPLINPTLFQDRIHGKWYITYSGDNERMYRMTVSMTYAASGPEFMHWYFKDGVERLIMTDEEFTAAVENVRNFEGCDPDEDWYENKVTDSLLKANNAMIRQGEQQARIVDLMVDARRRWDALCLIFNPATTL